jgi:hypothetical protein
MKDEVEFGFHVFFGLFLEKGEVAFEVYAADIGGLFVVGKWSVKRKRQGKKPHQGGVR